MLNFSIEGCPCWYSQSQHPLAISMTTIFLSRTRATKTVSRENSWDQLVRGKFLAVLKNRVGPTSHGILSRNLKEMYLKNQILLEISFQCPQLQFGLAHGQDQIVIGDIAQDTSALTLNTHDQRPFASIKSRCINYHGSSST